jgi:predicted MPP superfamily phosphohydrolase
MIISRGLGNSIFPVRINNDPEIVKVVLRKEK